MLRNLMKCRWLSQQSWGLNQPTNQTVDINKMVRVFFPRGSCVFVISPSFFSGFLMYLSCFHIFLFFKVCGSLLLLIAIDILHYLTVALFFVLVQYTFVILCLVFQVLFFNLMLLFFI